MTDLNGSRRRPRSLFRAVGWRSALRRRGFGRRLAADWPQWRGPNRDAISKETGLLDRMARRRPAARLEGEGHRRGLLGRLRRRRAHLHDGGGRAVQLRPRARRRRRARISGRRRSAAWAAGRATRARVRRRPSTATASTRSGSSATSSASPPPTARRSGGRTSSSDFKGRMMSGWGYSESPLVDGDKVVCTPGGRRARCSRSTRSTGKPVWRSKDFTDSAAYSSIVAGRHRRQAHVHPAHRRQRGRHRRGERRGAVEGRPQGRDGGHPDAGVFRQPRLRHVRLQRRRRPVQDHAAGRRAGSSRWRRSTTRTTWRCTSAASCSSTGTCTA